MKLTKNDLTAFMLGGIDTARENIEKSKKGLWQVFCHSPLRCKGLFFFAEGEDFDHEEGDWYAQDGCQEVADYWREAQVVVEDENDEVLDDVVWYVGNEEFHIAYYIQRFMEDDVAVHNVGDDIAYDVAYVEVQIVIG